jgi:hypothetical protein
MSRRQALRNDPNSYTYISIHVVKIIPKSLMAKKQTSLLMEEDLREWLSEQPGSMADTIRRAVQMYRVFQDPIRELGEIGEEATSDVLDIISEAANEYQNEDVGPTSGLDGSVVGQYQQPQEWRALKKLGLVLVKAEAREEGFRRLRPDRSPDDYSAEDIEFAP